MDDIPRELWLYLYNRVFVITAMLICLISLLFYLLEEFRYVLASWFRFWLHVILLLITIITGILIVKFFYPFASDMNLKIFGSMTADFLVQSILYLWPLAPTNYKGLFR